MTSPTYSAGSFGNVIPPATSLAAGANIAALIDLSTAIGGAVGVRMATGSSPPTSATTFAMHRVVGASATAPGTTLSSSAAANSGTISVASASGIVKGERIALISASTKLGEFVTVSGISGTTLTLSANTLYAYSASDYVFRVEQAASGGTVAPGYSWSANTPYGTSIYPPPAFPWVLHATNADATYAVTVSATLDTNPAFA